MFHSARLLKKRTLDQPHHQRDEGDEQGKITDTFDGISITVMQILYAK